MKIKNFIEKKKFTIPYKNTNQVVMDIADVKDILKLIADEIRIETNKLYGGKEYDAIYKTNKIADELES